MNKVLPILFNTEMVRAILAGRKTATRRVVKYKYSNTEMKMLTNKYGTRLIEIQKDIEGETYGKNPDGSRWRKLLPYIEKKPPYKKRDILYVRETWNYGYIETSDNPGNSEAWFEPLQPAEEHGPYIEALSRYVYKADENAPGSDVGMVWRPSIHMPKEAARIWLKVTDVRVERLHDMTLDDFLSEGVVIRPEAFNDPENAYWQARREFARIWDSTIGKSQTEINPWVWAIEFERCEKPESEE